MRAMLWIVLGLNALAGFVAGYVSLNLPPPAASVKDVLQVLAGVAILNAVAMIVLIRRKIVA